MSFDAAQWVSRLEALIENRASNAELAKILETLSEDRKTLKYNNTGYYVAAAACLPLILGSVLARSWFGVAPLTIILASTIIIIWRIEKLRDLRTKLQALYETNLLGLKDEEPWGGVIGAFSEFSRGNFDNQITRTRIGTFEGEWCPFEYAILDYHWIEEREEEVTKYVDGRSFKTTEINYYHYDRVAVLTDVDLDGAIYIQSERQGKLPAKWTTSSHKFNKTFEITASSEFFAALFLKPAVVLEIELLLGVCSSVNIEFKAGAGLLISMAPTDITRSGFQVNLHNLRATAQAFSSHGSQTLMRTILSVIESMKKYTEPDRIADRHPVSPAQVIISGDGLPPPEVTLTRAQDLGAQVHFGRRTSVVRRGGHRVCRSDKLIPAQTNILEVPKDEVPGIMKSVSERGKSLDLTLAEEVNLPAQFLLRYATVILAIIMAFILWAALANQ